MPHYKTVNRWLSEVRAASNARERLSNDIRVAGQNVPAHLELAKQELLLAIEEIKLGGAEGVGNAGRGAA